MKFSVATHDKFFFHTREIFMCIWDEDLGVMCQHPVASDIFSTKFFADRWVKDTLFNHLHAKGHIEYFRT